MRDDLQREDRPAHGGACADVEGELAGRPVGSGLRDATIIRRRRLARAIRTGAEPRSSSALGLEVVRAVEAAHRSIELSGDRVALIPTGALPAPIAR